MCERTAVPENRPRKAGMPDTLNHKSSSFSKAASLPPNTQSEVRPLLRIHRSTFAGVLCPLRAADVLWLWPPLHLDHVAVAVSSMPCHPCCSCMEKRDPQRVYNIFQLLVTPEGQCKREELSSLGGAEHSG